MKATYGSVPEPSAQPSAIFPDDLSSDIARLLAEVDLELSSSRWSLLNTGTDRVKWLAYSSAALRHCCRLLSEIEAGAQGGQELTVRVLGRVHLEAWLVALYIQLGGYEALTRFARDTRHNLTKLQASADQFDAQLKAERKDARKRRRKAEAANEGISRGNASNPNAPKPLHDLPYVPQLEPFRLDLNDVIDEFGVHPAQGLPISEIVEALTKWGPERGFAQESLAPVYVIYRFLSSVGAHTTMSVLEEYLATRKPNALFIKAAAAPNLGGPMTDAIRCSALYLTAALAAHVLGEHGGKITAAQQVAERWRPDPTGAAPWL